MAGEGENCFQKTLKKANFYIEDLVEAGESGEKEHKDSVRKFGEFYNRGHLCWTIIFEKNKPRQTENNKGKAKELRRAKSKWWKNGLELLELELELAKKIEEEYSKPSSVK